MQHYWGKTNIMASTENTVIVLLRPEDSD